MKTILIGSKSFGASKAALAKLNDVYELEYDVANHKIDGIIAGTEVYDAAMLSSMPNLKVVSRMGVGLDSVDLNYCAANGITVTYTPYGPTQSVVEMTMGFILTLLRNLHLSNNDLHSGEWTKRMGRQVSEVNIGILGTGRIGSRVLQTVSTLNPKALYACEIDTQARWAVRNSLVKWVDIKELFTKCDLVSIHIPNKEVNHHLIDASLISLMPEQSFIINTSRGPIVNENHLIYGLSSCQLAGVALDVFETEPYVDGELTKFDNVLMTSHLASMTLAARYRMENEAVDDCLRVLNNQRPIHEVPHEAV